MICVARQYSFRLHMATHSQRQFEEHPSLVQAQVVQHHCPVLRDGLVPLLSSEMSGHAPEHGWPTQCMYCLSACMEGLRPIEGLARQAHVLLDGSAHPGVFRLNTQTHDV